MPYDEREAQARRIDQMYSQVDDEIAALLAAAFATGLPGRVREAGQAAKLMLTQALVQVEVWHGEAIPELYGEWVGLSEITQPSITQASYDRFLAMTQTAGRRVEDLVRYFEVAVSRREALALFRSERAALTVDQLALEMEQTLREGGITGFVDSAGRKWKLRTYAEMAARTTTMEAEVAGVKDRVIASGEDLVRIVGPLDYPDGCPAAVLDGPYSITGATTNHLGRDVMMLDAAVRLYGVFHPRCRHSLQAVTVKAVA